MAKTTINPESDEAVHTEIVPSETAGAVAPSNSSVPVGYDADQYDDLDRDIETPSISIINKTGPLSTKFPKNTGEFAVGEVVLGDDPQVIPVALLKLFVESCRDGTPLKYGDGIMPRFFSTAADASKAGYFVDFDNVSPNRVEACSRAAFLVIKPDGVDDPDGLFYLEMPSGKFATLAKSSYRRGSHRGRKNSHPGVYSPLVNYATAILRRPGNGGTGGLDASSAFAKAAAYDRVWTLKAHHEINTAKKQDWYETYIERTLQLDAEDLSWISENYKTFSI